MVTTASSADPQTKNFPSSSSPSSMSRQQQQQQEQAAEIQNMPNSISNFTPKLPRTNTTATATTSNSNILPKFSSLPLFTVKWGRQQHVRCVNDERSDNDDDDDPGILAIKEKLMLDYRNQIDQIQVDFNPTTNPNIDIDDTTKPKPNNNNNNNDTFIENDSNNGGKGPWNLRMRRSVCKDPNTFSPEAAESPSKLNGVNGGGGDKVLPTRPRRKKFSPTLSRQEIADDLLAMGVSSSKRSKKRPKHVQRQIDGLFPGHWLSEITLGMYRVKEHHDTSKRH